MMGRIMGGRLDLTREELIEYVLQKFPEWNDSIQLDEYDVKGILSILESVGIYIPHHND